MKRVLITGITGYIGSNLARKLVNDGYEVSGIVREPLNTEYIVDFKDKLHLYVYKNSYESVLDIVNQAKPDVIFHMATCYAVSHSVSQIKDMNSCNITFGNYILEAMKECKVKNIVYPSTVFCNYKNESYNPLNLYAATKQAFSDIMRFYTESGDIHSLTLVLTDSYGPKDSRNKILNLIKKAYHEKQAIELSSGTKIYDVLYIDDIVNAFIAAGNLLENQAENSTIYQIYSENPVTLKETVEILKKAVNAEIDTKWGARKEAVRSIKDKVRVYPLLPGWKPQTPLQDGLKKFWID